MATQQSPQAQNGAQYRSESVDPLEKDFSIQDSQTYSNGANTSHMNDPNMSHGAALNRLRTAGSISISPEMFEKLYLSPQNNVKGDLRKTFGNPTPMYVYIPIQALHKTDD